MRGTIRLSGRRGNMVKQSVILCCYAFIAGLALSRWRPCPPHLHDWMYALTAAAWTAAAWLIWRDAWAGGMRRGLRWVLVLAVPSVLLGVSRYHAARIVSHEHVARIEVDGGDSMYPVDAEFDEPVRIKIVVRRAPDALATIRLTGQLAARQAVRDEHERPVIGTDGRWHFREVVFPQASETLALRPGAEGTEQIIEQPFTELETLYVEGGDGAVLELYRLPNHVDSFARPYGQSAPVTVLGRVTGDPHVYDFKTVLDVSPAFLQFRSGGTFYPVRGGRIRVTIKPDHPEYETFSRAAAYGYDVAIRSDLTSSRPSAFPGGFDPRRFYENHNIYGHMNVRQFNGDPPSLEAVIPIDAETPRAGNRFIEFSLDLRDRMLAVIKEVVPYPQSAFLGAVTLGLRYGLVNTPTLLKPLGTDPELAGAAADRDDYIFEEFKAAGVNHVLAVSGLHVTIITLMFVGIFTLLRIPRRIYAPVLILILVIFAVITGARPSTLRAVIMNSLFMTMLAYLDQNLRSSILLGVPVAAFLILMHNPLMLTDPSFTLSFGAILSLALLTGPFYLLLKKLKGWGFVAFIVAYAVLSACVLVRWHWFSRPGFWVVFALFASALSYAGARLTPKHPRFAMRFCFARLPLGLDYLFAAQLAIQVGMMLPLSALYFSRWPIAGAYVNMIAIPLVGVIIQLGMLSALLGMIPFIGSLPALILGAANWFFSSLFIGLAHTAAEAFPYPFMARPTGWMLAAYYGGCALFIWRGACVRFVRTLPEKLPRGGRILQIAAVAAVLLVFIVPIAARRSSPTGEAQVHVLPVEYGSACSLVTPSGKHLLIGGGFVEETRGRRNQAERVVLPYLAYSHRLSADLLMLPSLKPEFLAGATDLLRYADVNRLAVPASTAPLIRDGDLPAFRRFCFPEQTSFGAEATETARKVMHYVRGTDDDARYTIENFMRFHGLPPRHFNCDMPGPVICIGENDLYEEEYGGRCYRVRPLRPDRNVVDRCGFRIEYGDTAALALSGLRMSDLTDLRRRYDAALLCGQAVILPIPDGAEGENKRDVLRELEQHMEPFLHAMDPDFVVMEFGNPRPVKGHRYREIVNRYELIKQFLSRRMAENRIFITERDGMVSINSDGSVLSVQSWDNNR